jgi:ElaB/YqjD/DUF883 family membrane-anchored ribosome-binding protein
MMTGMKQNPIPAAMICIGAAWLLMTRSSRESRRPYAYGERYTTAGEYSDPRWYDEAGRYRRENMRNREYPQNRGRDNGGVMNRLLSHPVPTALAAMGLTWLAFSNGSIEQTYYKPGSRERTSGGDADESTMSKWADSASDAAGRAQEYAGDVTARAQEYANEAGEAVRRGSRQARNGLSRMLDENPLLVGAAALAIGAVVGASIPETEQENEWLGEARDNVLEQAEEMAGNAASVVQDAAADMAADVTSRIVRGEKP